MDDKLNKYEATITITFKVNVEAKNEELAEESVFDEWDVEEYRDWETPMP